jgi:chromosome segregation ATPase
MAADCTTENGLPSEHSLQLVCMQAHAQDRERRLQLQLNAQQNAGACVADEFGAAADELRVERDELRVELALMASERDRALTEAGEARAEQHRAKTLLKEREELHRNDLAKLKAALASEQMHLATVTSLISALDAAEQRVADVTAERDAAAYNAREMAQSCSLAQDSMVILQGKVLALTAQLELRDGLMAAAERSLGQLSEQARNIASEKDSLVERIRTFEAEQAAERRSLEEKDRAITELLEKCRGGELRSLHFFQLIVAFYHQAGELLRAQPCGDLHDLVRFQHGIDRVEANLSCMLDAVMRALQALVRLVWNLKGLSTNLLGTVQLCSRAPNLHVAVPSKELLLLGPSM